MDLSAAYAGDEEDFVAPKRTVVREADRNAIAIPAPSRRRPGIRTPHRVGGGRQHHGDKIDAEPSLF